MKIVMALYFILILLATIIGIPIQIVLGLAVGIPVYFLPAFLAYNGQHPYKGVILLVDILLGWTFLGWVGALVWACITPKEEKITNIINNNNKYEDLERLQRLKENGTISEEEFKIEKEKILKQ